MNKNLLTIALTVLALAGVGQLAAAHEEDEHNAQPVAQTSDPRYDVQRQYDPRYQDPRNSDARQFPRRGAELEREFDHLNRMLAHVQGELRRYGADRHAAQEYDHVRGEANQLTNQFRRGEQSYNRRRLRTELAHVHAELHHIEEELHVPAAGRYQWR